MYDLTVHYKKQKPVSLQRGQLRKQNTFSHPIKPQNYLEEEEDEEEYIQRNQQPPRRQRVQNVRRGGMRSRAAAEASVDPSNPFRGKFGYSTFESQGQKFILFPKESFIALFLTLSVGIGVLAVDVRRILRFLIHSLITAFKSVTG